METPVITPIHDPLITPLHSAEDAVAGSDVQLMGLAPDQRQALSEEWLDELASGLSEHGWMSLDVRSRIGDNLLAALKQEVQILDRTDAMKKAGIGRGNDLVRDRSVRRDKIAWLQGITAPQAALFEFFERIRQGLNQRLFLGLKRFETHYATYHSGDFYKQHLDSFKGRASRVVSLVLYLNEEWQAADGGALQVFNRDNDHEVCGTVLPEAGRMALFMSEEIPHEVLPANRTRYSLACWFRQDEVPLPL
ncbi:MULTISPECIES: 2OG-Fe(II) oxygenase [unclassified Marinobacter]|jgi:SM-20-related protein|uniref:2OG-Fe(II) oxygenase n=1 Tax=unclassified Marinobacter TaxID=83889 RepID=UPI000C8E84EC|nr:MULTISPECIES: 2OG-Fe(II) oxygenase [unclassified Marinobacter]MAK48893.1 2OG-Fe(II) oxygenase [Marinobacter sp.]|tara:strand:+ start:360 stop:1109 length:750 start_codon:yes stop_codon:yes gene_type:complete